MGNAGQLGPRRGRACAAVVALLAVSACASNSSGQADQRVPSADVADGADGSSIAPSGIDSDEGFRSEAAMAESTTTSTPTARSTPPFDEMARSAAPKGRSTALLTDVRTGRHDGYERIVFDFAGDERPGYQVEWVDGPVAAAGSGRIVDVAGSHRLRIIFDPASGMDLTTGDISYVGPNRLEVAADGSTIRDVVRSGDFEGVMTWVAGTDERVPFRVITLSEPTRVVVDAVVPREP